MQVCYKRKFRWSSLDILFMSALCIAFRKLLVTHTQWLYLDFGRPKILILPDTQMRICDYRPPHLWNIRASRLKNLRCIPTSQTSQQPLAMISEEWILWPLLIKEFRWLLVPHQVWNRWLLLSRVSIQWHGSITCDCWWHQMESQTVLIFLLENWCSSSGEKMAAEVLEAIDKIMTMVVVETVINDRWILVRDY